MITIFVPILSRISAFNFFFYLKMLFTLKFNIYKDKIILILSKINIFTFKQSYLTNFIQ